MYKSINQSALLNELQEENERLKESNSNYHKRLSKALEQRNKYKNMLNSAYKLDQETMKITFYVRHEKGQHHGEVTIKELKYLLESNDIINLKIW